ncbi:uncharacterized protein [Antedon mediterranea]|uniref:uncharacterized protein n=1 Tax=Antedon mediterranea TaxID=105859 RepID=UPI003AF7130C
MKRGRPRGSKLSIGSRDATPTSKRSKTQAGSRSPSPSESSRCSTPIGPSSASQRGADRRESRRVAARKTKELIHKVVTESQSKKKGKTKKKGKSKSSKSKSKIVYDDESEDEKFEDLLPLDSDTDSGGLLSDNKSDSDAQSEIWDESSVTSGASSPSSVKRKYIRHSRPVSPIYWLNKNIKPLVLPESSDDLILPRELILDALSVYEVLRHFFQQLRLSPFRLEDFCAAIASEEQCILLAETHIALLKNLMKEEEANGTTFGPQDVKDSINVQFHFLDPVTWPELVRSYVECDPEFTSILNSFTDVYPFQQPKDKIKVLKFLTDQFLATNKVREEIVSEGAISYDDHCRSCHRLGDLICCETCSAVYHLQCVDPNMTEVPDEDWLCEVCIAHKVPGVYDCISEVEKSGMLIRQEPLGFDRHGRKYFFLCRRLFVESENDCWYYSSKIQIEDLLRHLNPYEYESSLCTVLTDCMPEILDHVKITEELTNKARGTLRSYLDESNAKIVAIEEERLAEEERKREEEKLKEAEIEKIKDLPEVKDDQPTEGVDPPSMQQEQVHTVLNEQSGELNVVEGKQDDTIEEKGELVSEVNVEKMETQEVVTTTTTTMTTVETKEATCQELQQTSDEAMVTETITQTSNITQATSTTTTTVSTEIATTTSPETSTSTSVPTETSTSTSLPTETSTLTSLPTENMATTVTTKSVEGSNTEAIASSKVEASSEIAPETNENLSEEGSEKVDETESKEDVIKNRTIVIMNIDGSQSTYTIKDSSKDTDEATAKKNAIMTRSRNPNYKPPPPKATPFVTYSTNIPKVTKSVTQAPTTNTKINKDDNAVLVINSKGEIKKIENKKSNGPVTRSSEKLFKLGLEGTYKLYKNQFTINRLALNKPQHAEDRDKRRYLSYKFSLSARYKFDWMGAVYGQRAILVSTHRMTLSNLERNIPKCFLHHNWQTHRNNWLKAINLCSKPKEFCLALSILECAIKPVFFSVVWNDGLGHSKMKRMTVMERDEKKKHEKKRKDEEEDSQKLGYWVKYSFPIKHQLWKQKGEEYRAVGGKGWHWVSSTRHSRPLPNRSPALQCLRNSIARAKANGTLYLPDHRQSPLEIRDLGKVIECKKRTISGMHALNDEGLEEMEITEMEETCEEEHQLVVDKEVGNVEEKLPNKIEKMETQDAAEPSKSSTEVASEKVENKPDVKSDLPKKVLKKFKNDKFTNMRFDELDIGQAMREHSVYKKISYRSKLEGLLEHREKQHALENEAYEADLRKYSIYKRALAERTQLQNLINDGETAIKNDDFESIIRKAEETVQLSSIKAIVKKPVITGEMQAQFKTLPISQSSEILGNLTSLKTLPASDIKAEFKTMPPSTLINQRTSVDSNNILPGKTDVSGISTKSESTSFQAAYVNSLQTVTQDKLTPALPEKKELLSKEDPKISAMEVKDVILPTVKTGSSVSQNQELHNSISSTVVPLENEETGDIVTKDQNTPIDNSLSEPESQKPEDTNSIQPLIQSNDDHSDKVSAESVTQPTCEVTPEQIIHQEETKEENVSKEVNDGIDRVEVPAKEILKQNLCTEKTEKMESVEDNSNMEVENATEELVKSGNDISLNELSTEAMDVTEHIESCVKEKTESIETETTEGSLNDKPLHNIATEAEDTVVETESSSMGFLSGDLNTEAESEDVQMGIPLEDFESDTTKATDELENTKVDIANQNIDSKPIEDFDNNMMDMSFQDLVEPSVNDMPLDFLDTEGFENSISDLPQQDVETGTETNKDLEEFSMNLPLQNFDTDKTGESEDNTIDTSNQQSIDSSTTFESSPNICSSDIATMENIFQNTNSLSDESIDKNFSENVSTSDQNSQISNANEVTNEKTNLLDIHETNKFLNDLDTIPVNYEKKEICSELKNNITPLSECKTAEHNAIENVDENSHIKDNLINASDMHIPTDKLAHVDDQVEQLVVSKKETEVHIQNKDVAEKTDIMNCADDLALVNKGNTLSTHSITGQESFEPVADLSKTSAGQDKIKNVVLSIQDISQNSLTSFNTTDDVLQKSATPISEAKLEPITQALPADSIVDPSLPVTQLVIPAHSDNTSQEISKPNHESNIPSISSSTIEKTSPAEENVPMGPPSSTSEHLSSEETKSNGSTIPSKSTPQSSQSEIGHQSSPQTTASSLPSTNPIGFSVNASNALSALSVVAANESKSSSLVDNVVKEQTVTKTETIVTNSVTVKTTTLSESSTKVTTVTTTTTEKKTTVTDTSSQNFKRKYTQETLKALSKKLSETLIVPVSPPIEYHTYQTTSLTKYTKTKKTVKKVVNNPLPICRKFSTKSNRKSILILPPHLLKRLARHAGRLDVEGFIYNTKAVRQYHWPYPCPRPSFKTCWRYRVQTLNSLASVGVSLRILWASLRWEDLGKIGNHHELTETETIQTEILKKREIGHNGERTEYLLRKTYTPIVEDLPKEYHKPQRSGLRSSSAPVKATEDEKPKGPLVTERWVTEESLELWEIQEFSDRMDKEIAAQLQAKQQEILKEKQKAKQQQDAQINKSAQAIQEQLEQQLKSQRQAMQQKRLQNTMKSGGKIQFANTLTLGDQSSGAKLPVPAAATKILSKNAAAQKVVISSGLRTITPRLPSTPGVKIQTVNQSPLQRITIRPQGQQAQTSQPATQTLGQIKLTLPGQSSGTTPTIIRAQVPVPLTAAQAQSTGQSQVMGQAQIFASQAQVLQVGGQKFIVTPAVVTVPTTGQTIPAQLIQTQTNQGTTVQRLVLTPNATGASTSTTTTTTTTQVPQINLNTTLTALQQAVPSTSNQQAQQQQTQQQKQQIIQNQQQIQQQASLLQVFRQKQMEQMQQIASMQTQDKQASIIIQDPKRLPGKGGASRSKMAAQQDRAAHSRELVCRNLLKQMLDKIERNEKMDLKRKRQDETREEKREEKRIRLMAHKLSSILYKHKDQLKNEMRRKRYLLEQKLLHDVQEESKSEVRREKEMARKRKQQQQQKQQQQLLEQQQQLQQEEVVAPVPVPVAIYKSPPQDVKQEVTNEILVTTPKSPTTSPKRKRTDSTKSESKPDKGKPTSSKGTSLEKEARRKSNVKLYCICKTPYDAARFYIGCDVCLNWFHGECVNISADEAQTIKDFICSDCQQQKQEQEDELYCICRTPYDDAQFYIGCDLCNDWFHGECVGIGQEEAESIDSYVCNKCQSKQSQKAFDKNLTHRDMDQLRKIVRQLQSHKMAWPFLEPVNKEDVPDYYEIIKEPMDLTTVETKLKKKKYQKLSDFTYDVGKVFDNCRFYNASDSPFYQCADILEKFFVHKMKSFKH